MAMMALHFMPARAFVVVLFFFFSLCSSNSSVVGSSCDLTSVCKTYLTFFAKSPDFLDLDNVSDLFGVRRSLIADASNLNAENGRRLFPGELLLIPVNCTCSGNQYFANITYQIKEGDVYYTLAMTSFQNLTEWHLVNASNPNLGPSLLHKGDEVTFPLYCKCPSKTDIEKRINYFVTYIWRPTDNISVVSNEFNVSSDAVLAENNYTDMKDAANLPVFIPLSRLPLFSHVSPNETKTNGKHRKIIVVLISVGSSIFIVVLIVGLVCAHFVHKNRKSVKWNKVSVEITSTPTRNKGFGAKTDLKDDRLLPKVSDYLSKPIRYDINAIMEATKNLNRCTRVGGSVYRATIDKQVVAIKKSKEDITEELNILQKVNHVNLVKVIGFSTDVNWSCFLVYEYAENGSLDKWLSSSSLPTLTWDQRISIALDVANGLQYMHEHIQPSIVHRDIRTSNILLDSRMRAKITNLSMAKPALNTTSHKIDIFAFGVVLLELLSGKNATEMKGDDDAVMLWKVIREVMDGEETKEGGLRTWMDPRLKNFYPIDGALNLIDLAMTCTHDLPMVRPSMTEIVFNLSVLTQSSSLISLERSWVLGLESIEISEKVDTVLAR